MFCIIKSEFKNKNSIKKLTLMRLFVRLRTKWFWIRVQLQSLKRLFDFSFSLMKYFIIIIIWLKKTLVGLKSKKSLS